MVTPVSASTKTGGTLTKSKKLQVINFMAGGLAGMVSSTITTPLEVIKTQLQASTVKIKNPIEVANKVISTQGVGGLFKGIKPMLVGIIPTRAIYFWSYSTSKEKIGARLGDNSFTHLLSAFSAGITR